MPPSVGDNMVTKADLEIIRRMHAAQKLSLQFIRLLESHSKLGPLQQGKLPGKGTQSVVMGVNIDSAKKILQAGVDLKLVMAYEEGGDHDPPIQVSAKFHLQYAIEKIPRQKQLLEEALQQVAMMNVWPYWREFVQSSSVRMGLPALPVPLFHLAQLEKLLPEQGEKKTK
jgi:hypothetical protein